MNLRFSVRPFRDKTITELTTKNKKKPAEPSTEAFAGFQLTEIMACLPFPLFEESPLLSVFVMTFSPFIDGSHHDEDASRYEEVDEPHEG